MKTTRSNKPTQAHAVFALAGAMLVRVLAPQRALAEDHIDTKYELYKEDNNRVQVRTFATELEKKLTTSTIARARFVYDSISGASPVGLPPPPGSDQVPVKELSDIRRAVNAEVSQRWGGHTLLPAFSYSIESDYESYGIAYTHAFEFNEKNTTLTLGASHDFDRVLDGQFHREYQSKDTTDALLGLTQLLGPKTILSVNLTGGYAEGYLNDPYKRVAFDSYDPTGRAGFREKRPMHKAREVALLSLTQYISPLNASFEASYRLHHDSYGSWAHTGTLNWNQKLGKHFVVSPILRFHNQSAADFYTPRVDASYGDPLVPGKDFPSYYSADYRLSSLHSWTYGLKATWNAGDHFSVDVGYKRYEMFGNDKATSASAYPSANVFTAGLAIWF